MTPDSESSTHDKLLKAAKLVFFEKGYDGTRTRDIASAAGVNLAMLNYHFKSKEHLFNLVIMDALKDFTSVIKEVLYDPHTDFETKLEILVSKYIDKFREEPLLPFFVISQLHKNPDAFAQSTSQSHEIPTSVFLQQYQEGVKHGKYKPVNFVHLLMNIGGLIIFPFLISSALKDIANLSQPQLHALMEERKSLILKWLKQMLTHE